MRWNCPHCGVALSASDQAFHKGWSFARCYQCAGVALVRRTETNVLKVDQAPPGENVILPEPPLPTKKVAERSFDQNLLGPSAAASPWGPPPVRPAPEPRPRYGLLKGVAIGCFLGMGVGLAWWWGADESTLWVVSDRVQQKAAAPLVIPAVGTLLKGLSGPFYTGPGVDFPVVQPVPLGDQFRVEETRGLWLRLQSTLENQAHFRLWLPQDQVSQRKNRLPSVAK